MKRTGWMVFFVIFVLVITFSLTATITASPSQNSGNGPPELDKKVFVHYPKGMDPGKPSGSPGKGPQEDSFIYSGYHWADPAVVSYSVNLSGAAQPDLFKSGIDAGFQVWEDEAGSYTDFNDNGATDREISALNNVADGANVIGWANISSLYKNAIAVTMFWYNPLTKELSEVDVAFNSDPLFNWQQSSAADENWDFTDTAAYDVDVQNIMAHEAGHWLVLEDLYADSNADKTLYGYSGQMELSKRSLAEGDIGGICTIYPAAQTQQPKMHVGNINMYYSGTSNYFVYTEVTVLDEMGAYVPSAVVNVSLLLPDNVTTLSTSATTNSTGVAVIKVKTKQKGTYTSTIAVVSKTGYIYDSGSNIETMDSLLIP